MSQLREIRKRKQLSQADVAVRMNTTPATISRYENQDQRLNIPLLRKFSQVLNVSIAEIVGELNQPTIKKIKLLNAEGKTEMYIDDKIPCCNFLGLNEDDLFGYVLENDVMSPSFKAGDCIICNKEINVLEDDGVLVFENANQERFVARSTYNPITRQTNFTTDNPLNSDYGTITDESNIKILGRMVATIKSA